MVNRKRHTHPLREMMLLLLPPGGLLPMRAQLPSVHPPDRAAAIVIVNGVNGG